MTLFDDAEVEAPARTRVRMLIAYEGSGFKGFALQAPGVRTVAGVLAEACQRVLRHPVKFTVAGRTDAGVHAWGNVVHFDSPLAPADIDLAALQRGINKICRPSIVVRCAEVVDFDFDARHSAVERHYRYTIVNRPVPDPFLASAAWHVEHPLDVRAMEAAGDPLIGEHDFASFCRKPAEEGRTTVRRVIDCRWLELGDGVLRFDIDAQSFCHQMVRSIVGTLVDVGLGKKKAGDIAWILRAQDRQHAGPVAPPQGLCLWEVVYP